MIKVDRLFKVALIFSVTLTILIAFREWIFTANILTHGDWGFFFRETAISIRGDYFSTWLSDFSFGRILIDLPQAFFYSLYGALPLFLNLPYEITERAIHLWPILFLSLVGTGLLIHKIFNNLIATIIGSLVFIGNTYALTLDTGHITLAAAFSLLPLLLYSFLCYLENPRFQQILFVVLIALAMCSYEPRAFYIAAFLLALYTVFDLLLGSKEYFFSRLRQFYRYLAPAAVIFLLLNLFWLLALTKIGSLESNYLLLRELFGNHFWNIFYSFTLHHPWWSPEGVQVFENQPIPSHFWLLPLTAFLGLVIQRKNKLVVFAGALGLIGILLSKQVDSPWENLYPWLFENFPGFKAFREASKFYSLIVISYSILTAAFVDWIWRNWSVGTIKVIGKYLLIIAIAGSLLWNFKPLITGEIGTLFVARNIPTDYSTLNNFILIQPDYFRTFWIPRDSRWGVYTRNHSKLSAITLVDSVWMDFTSHSSDRAQDRMISLFSTPYADSLFDLSSIKYVIVPTQDIENDDDFFIDYGGRENPEIRKLYLDHLNSIPWLYPVDLNTAALVVYENKGYKPHIFSFTNLLSLESVDNLERKYDFISNQLAKQFFYTIDSPHKSSKPLMDIKNPFENFTIENISTSTITSTFKSVDGKKTAGYIIQKRNGEMLINSSVLSQASIRTLVSAPIGTSTISYMNPLNSYENLMINGSFEDGTWQREVGDCNRFDNNGLLAMSLNTSEKTEGDQSLQLEATRHIACTSQSISVNAGTYLLSFDYQSPNAASASYYIGFDNSAKTSIRKMLSITDKGWHRYSEIIEIPAGTRTLSFNVYARAKDGITNIINRYDNIQLIEVPDLRGALYIVREPIFESALEESTSIIFEFESPTKKKVHVKAAATSFFLAMTESYHDQWQLQLNNGEIHGLVNSWWPFAKPDRVADEYHYQLNGFLNAWYVDTEELCEVKQLCTKNADGSYNIEFVIEFWPQRWFYLGLLISGTTLIGCLGYLGYEGVKRIRRKLYA